MEKQNICPIVETIKVIGSEAKLLVLRYLFDGSKGFNELQRVTKLSSKTLSNTLKDLEEAGIVKRVIISDRPFRVKYELTEKGKELRTLFTEMEKWGTKHLLSVDKK
ncbi:transcriptional regulator [Sulfolobus sp. S-194]|uniref:winged helix-turn-helix transcriptional regulator n=1 Tax=Sulfolobus sp. S-194 TaxID=2512240 RepID=UPI001436FD82|nr:helix-turn-helix domain-containing protein [Sulfolobus sp. S-194]QIW23623.1 transcriptional regulator [Sulfolobus sp. S-194]